MDRGEDRDNYLHLPQLCPQPHCSVSGGLIGTIIHHAEQSASFGPSRDARYRYTVDTMVNSKYYVFMLENWDRIYRISIFQSWIGAYILAYIRTRVRCWPVTRTSDRTNKNDGDNPLPFVSGGHAPLRRHRPHHPSCPHQSPPAHQHWPVGGLNLDFLDH